MKMLKLGQLARRSGLARSSLLHYEALGLLRASARSAAGYRLYDGAEVARLDAIRSYREAGLSLAAIAALLDGHGGNAAQLLERRLCDLNAEIGRLREQQLHLATLLAQPELRAGHGPADKDAWVDLLRRAGFDEQDMRDWHRKFETDAPDMHAEFLASLGLAPAEVERIRRWSVDDAPDA